MGGFGFYFDDFDMSRKFYELFSEIVEEISKKESITYELAFHKFIHSKTFNDFKNPYSMLWACKIDSVLTQYYSKGPIVYEYNGQDISALIEFKIDEVIKKIAHDNNYTIEQAAYCFIGSDYFDSFIKPDFLKYEKNEIEIVEDMKNSLVLRMLFNKTRTNNISY